VASPCSSPGAERRREALRGPEGFYCWVAADHGLTFGPIPDLESSAEIESMATLPTVSGLVVNPGIARQIRSTLRTPLVIQTFGYPRPASGPYGKVPTSTVSAAGRLGAMAVAVELNLALDDVSRAIGSVVAHIEEASGLGLPVLVMVGTREPRGGPEIAFAIRAATELGADLIKVGLPSDHDQISATDRIVMSRAVDLAPPTLLAGGPINEPLPEKLKLAAHLGFSGVCVGRHLLASPEATVDLISSTFGPQRYV
jgi:DhnA family fructose-bisphosphate aldolase class Ia